jgi:putative pyoverdin transport system ATP-binding/permease protein
MTFMEKTTNYSVIPRLRQPKAMIKQVPIYLFDEWVVDQDPFFREIFYQDILPELKEAGQSCVGD